MFLNTPSPSHALCGRSPESCDASATSIRNATYAALAAAYLRPWRNGVTQRQVDEAHLHWADYRDPEWGGFLPLGSSNNRLLRINILGGRLHFVNCAGSKSQRRLTRQRAALRLLQWVLNAHTLPDVDLVISIVDRPTVPKRAVPAGVEPPPVFGYARTSAHYAIPFPPVSFDPLRWPRLHANLGRSSPALTERAPIGLWRGSCNSLCDMMKHRKCTPNGRDLPLLDRYLLLRAASRCPRLADVAITSSHRNCPGAIARAPVPMAAHSRFAFLLHADGNGFSGRLDELLTLGSAVLKQDSPFEAFYYPLLRRGTHFVALDKNFSNVCRVLRGLSSDLRASAATAAAAPAEGYATAAGATTGNHTGGDRGSGVAVRVAAAGKRFAREHLSLESVGSYLASLIRQYAALQRFTPRLHLDAVAWSDDDRRPYGGTRVVRSHGGASGAELRDGVAARGTAKDATRGGAARRRGGGGGSGGVCRSGDALCCKRHPKACRRQGAAGAAGPGSSSAPSPRLKRQHGNNGGNSNGPAEG